MGEMQLELSSMLEDAAHESEDISHQVMEIADEDGQLLASVPFRNPS